jgi:hypothetical protein
MVIIPWSCYLGRVDGDRGPDRAKSQKRYQSRILATARDCAVSAFMEHLRPSAGVYEVALGWASLFCNGSRNGSPGPYSKLILSCSTTSGRFCTRVWMVPMYSPMMPINSIWSRQCTEVVWPGLEEGGVLTARSGCDGEPSLSRGMPCLGRPQPREDTRNHRGGNDDVRGQF